MFKYSNKKTRNRKYNYITIIIKNGLTRQTAINVCIRHYIALSFIYRNANDSNLCMSSSKNNQVTRTCH